jgi:hypothetical protein
MGRCMKCGGSAKKGGVVPAKKMQKGGTAGVVGMPKYGNNPRTSDGNMLKKGGSISKPKMAKGGATKFGMLSVKAGVDKNPRATAADRIAGAKMRKKK